MAQTASPADINAVQDILKEVYTSDTIESQLFDDALLYSQLEKTTEYHDSVGDKAIGFVRIGRNTGISSRSLNGGTLGAPDHQKVDRWELDYAATYLQIKILGTTIAKMKTARQAAVRAIDHEVSNGLVDFKKDVQRQLYGSGDGHIATAGVTAGSTTLVFTDTDGSATDALVRGWLAAGQYVDIGTDANPTLRTSDNKITAVDSSVPSVTLTNAVTTAATDFVRRAGNTAAASVSYEMNGLRKLVNNSGVFAAIDSATVPEWKSFVKDESAATLTRAMMQEAWRNVRQYGGTVGLILGSLEQQESYYNTLQAQVRFAGDAKLASGGVEGPAFNNVPVSADPDCPRQDLYFLDKKHLFMVSAGDIQWQNVNTGGDILAWVQDEDAFQARAALYANLGTTKRRAHARLKNLDLTP